MIPLSNKIKSDITSNINSAHMIIVINPVTTTANHYLSTKPMRFWSSQYGYQHYDDIIMKVSPISESVDIRTKKIKNSATSITLSNAGPSGEKFTDKIQGELAGSIVNIYIKTPNCPTLEDCIQIGAFKVSSLSHDSMKIVIKCDDIWLDNIHKELPHPDWTLYKDKDTLNKNNDRRIPILYGHLKEAPAIVYLNDYESLESSYDNNNVWIIPNRSALDDSYKSIGIKNTDYSIFFEDHSYG